MKICGLVAEFNPFHNGHVEYLKQAKKLTNADLYVLVMSPNFVQRGEPAIIGKDSRVKDALDNGVDLVVELPTIFAVESADIFASSALSLLNDLNANYIVFGTESGDTKAFTSKFKKKDFLSPRMDEIIQEYLEKGYSYPKAKSEAIKVVHDFYLENPNDILGYSYLKCLAKDNYPIEPLCYQRVNNEKSTKKVGEFSSAMAIRNAYKKVANMRPLYNFLDDYFDILQYRLLTTPPSELANIHLVDEGIENLLIKNAQIAKSMDEFIELSTSKRYSGARIKRTIIHILLNTSKEFAKKTLANKPPYVRVLGSSKAGRKYLASLRKDCPINIVTRFSAKDNPLLLDELKASNVFYSIKREPQRSELQKKEKTHFPINI